MSTREEFITGLRQLADFLTVNPDVPVPSGRVDIQVSVIHGSDEEKRAFVDRAALAMGAETFHPYGSGSHWEAGLRFGPVHLFAVAVTEAHMADYREETRLGAEALAAKKAAQALDVEEYEPAPFVKATPAEVAAAYEGTAVHHRLTVGGPS